MVMIKTAIIFKIRFSALIFVEIKLKDLIPLTKGFRLNHKIISTSICRLIAV